MMPHAPTVLVVDDDASFRTSVSRLLRSHGMESRLFESAAAVMACRDLPEHGCMVLDVWMPGLDGLAFQEQMLRNGWELPIIFLTGHGDIPMSVRAIKNGASDFLTKPVDEQRLLEAIRRALAEAERMRGQQQRVAAIRARIGALTPREHEVMQHVISGELNKQIGSDLEIALKTVKVHRARVMEKLGVESVAELVRLCAEAGVEPMAGKAQHPVA